MEARHLGVVSHLFVPFFDLRKPLGNTKGVGVEWEGGWGAGLLAN